MKTFALPLIVISRITSADPPLEPKSEDVALALSLGGAAVSIGTIVGGAMAYKGGSIDERTWYVVGAAGFVGLLFLPSAGHAYADDAFSTGLEIRVGSLLGGIGLLAVLPCPHSSDPVEGLGCSGLGTKAVGLYAGAAGLALGIGWDVATARRAARAYNGEHHLVVAPMPLPGGGTGLAIAGTF